MSDSLDPPQDQQLTSISGKPRNPKRGKGGRPTLISEELQEQIVALVRQGNYVDTVASYVGLCKQTVFGWLKRGARERRRMAKEGKKEPLAKEKPFVEFLDAIERARAHAEMAGLQIINKAAESGQWAAMAWRLERTAPNKFGRREKHEISGPGGKPVPVEAANLDRAIESELAKLAERSQAGPAQPPQGP